MSNYLERFDEDFDELVGSDPVLPEDEQTLIRTVEITKEVFQSPRGVKFDHLYSAIETWESLQVYVRDPHVSDLVGEVIDLLNQVFKKRTLAYQDAELGRQTLRTLCQFLGIRARIAQHD